jgi:hypothetical protein
VAAAGSKQRGGGVRTTLAFNVAACLVLAATNALAARNSSARLQAFAKLPDWSGWWEIDPLAAGSPALPYNAQWQARYEQLRQTSTSTSAGGEPLFEHTMTPCVWGFPRVLDGPYRFEVTVTPEQTMFDYEVREYRHVWTDGRGHPPEGVRKASTMGHSTGHWDGEVLLVDTVGLSSATWIDGYGATLSSQAHVSERWSQPQPDQLQVQLSIEDPVAFTRSFQLTHLYRRVSDSHRPMAQDCFERLQQRAAVDQKQTAYAAGGSNAN